MNVFKNVGKTVTTAANEFSFSKLHWHILHVLIKSPNEGRKRFTISGEGFKSVPTNVGHRQMQLFRKILIVFFGAEMRVSVLHLPRARFCNYLGLSEAGA